MSVDAVDEVRTTNGEEHFSQPGGINPIMKLSVRFNESLHKFSLRKSVFCTKEERNVETVFEKTEPKNGISEVLDIFARYDVDTPKTSSSAKDKINSGNGIVELTAVEVDLLTKTLCEELKHDTNFGEYQGANELHFKRMLSLLDYYYEQNSMAVYLTCALVLHERLSARDKQQLQADFGMGPGAPGRQKFLKTLWAVELYIATSCLEDIFEFPLELWGECIKIDLLEFQGLCKAYLKKIDFGVFIKFEELEETGKLLNLEFQQNALAEYAETQQEEDEPPAPGLAGEDLTDSQISDFL